MQFSIICSEMEIAFPVEVNLRILARGKRNLVSLLGGVVVLARVSKVSLFVSRKPVNTTIKAAIPMSLWRTAKIVSCCFNGMTEVEGLTVWRDLFMRELRSRFTEHDFLRWMPLQEALSSLDQGKRYVAEGYEWLRKELSAATH